MALDFPANPTNGQVYDSYVYNSTVGAWQSREDSRTVAILSSTVPASANPGDIWVNTNDGISFVYYDDGTSAQWMELLPSGVPLLNTKANLSGGNTFPDGINYFGAGGLNGTFISSSSGRAQFITNNATVPALIIKAATSQTSDIQQWQDSTSAVISKVDSAGSITAPRFISTQATGTAPLTVSSTTVVANLNADLLDGQHASVYSPAGMVSQFAGAAAPTGWLLCDGSAVSRSTYADLFTAIGTTYGTGDGSTTFNLPNLQGRVPVGKSTSGTFASLNSPGGVESVTLTAAQSGVPAHSHANTLSDPGHSHGFSIPVGAAVWEAGGFGLRTDGNGFTNRGVVTGLTWTGLSTSSASTGLSISNVNNTATNASQSHTNLQPYIVMNYIIKT